MKEYESPVVVANEEIAEGVYAASGSAADACEYTNPTVTVNERDFGTNSYRVTIKADHVGEVNDRKNATIYLTSTVSLSDFAVRTQGYATTNASGTSFTITYTGSHHSELNCEVSFTAPTEPDFSVSVSV